jgi:hypothetical protein
MRDSIIAKHSSTDFPNGSEDLLSDNEEDEDEEDTMTAEERNKSAQKKGDGSDEGTRWSP